MRQQSVPDLKAYFRGYRYLEEVLKLLLQKPEPIFLAQMITKVAN